MTIDDDVDHNREEIEYDIAIIAPVVPCQR
jgi:hypothetical protein